MNKHAFLLACLQVSFPLRPQAVYTLQKIPNKSQQIYKISYQLNNRKHLKEKGILKETIQDLSSAYYDNLAYKLEYQYQAYSQDKLKNYSQYYFGNNIFRNRLVVDHFFNISECSDIHPLIFHFYSIRAGLITECLKEGSSWSANLVDNKHTYLRNPNHICNFKPTDTVSIQYTIKNIKDPEDIFKQNLVPDIDDFENLCISDNILPTQYTITWNALSMFGYPTRRHGELIINSEGTIEMLSFHLPCQLKEFSIKDEQILEQPITLIIKKIDKTKLKNIKSKNPTLLIFK